MLYHFIILIYMVLQSTLSNTVLSWPRYCLLVPGIVVVHSCASCDFLVLSVV